LALILFTSGMCNCCGNWSAEMVGKECTKHDWHSLDTRISECFESSWG